jgi:hypothetical protein
VFDWEFRMIYDPKLHDPNGSECEPDIYKTALIRYNYAMQKYWRQDWLG